MNSVYAYISVTDTKQMCEQSLTPKPTTQKKMVAACMPLNWRQYYMETGKCMYWTWKLLGSRDSSVL